ncbi:MAG: radical SAM protein [Ruminococcus flavefaciens]|nr:radical SAM protein [Ruminococcus flavefaciens]
MRISHESITNSLGPGKRYVIWVQGCKKNCPNCINPEGRKFSGGYTKSVKEIINCITSLDDICGITVSGGEPFLQYNELKELITLLKLHTKLDVMLYSGYTYSEILAMYPDSEEFFRNVDIFVDGEYLDEMNSGSAYRGSDNQDIYFFTEKYKPYAEKILSSKQRDFSFEIDDNGEIYFIGIPPKDFYSQFLRELEDLE